MTDAYTELLASYREALTRLSEALAVDVAQQELALDAAIQRFEFCFELCWKLLQKKLRAEGIDAASPRQALSEAHRLGWIDNEALWLSMLRDRNLTSHTYKKALALEIHGRLGGYLAALRGVGID